MSRYQYKEIMFARGDVVVVDILNAEGEQGWQLVLADEVLYEGYGRRHHVVLMREMPSQEGPYR